METMSRNPDEQLDQGLTDTNQGEIPINSTINVGLLQLEHTHTNDDDDDDIQQALKLSLEISTEPNEFVTDHTLINGVNNLQESSEFKTTSSQYFHASYTLDWDHSILPKNWPMLLGPEDGLQLKHTKDSVYDVLSIVWSHTNHLTVPNSLTALDSKQPVADISIVQSHEYLGRNNLDKTVCFQLLHDSLEVVMGRVLTVTFEEFRRWWLTHYHIFIHRLMGIGLIQDYGGPCGVLAPLQCWITVYNLLHQGREKELPPPAITSSYELQAEALAWALSICLYRATPRSLYYILTLSGNIQSISFDGLPNKKLTVLNLLQYIHAKVTVFESITDVFQYYKNEFINQFTPVSSSIGSPIPPTAPLLAFVLSLVITRGTAAVKEDMDDSTMPLIGLYGHSSQELVNLLLTGKAVSNVFDGTRTLGGEEIKQTGESGSCLKLKGIHTKQIIGYLTELEALRYCEVGRFLKNPVFPVWVIGSPNHFTSMFSSDFTIVRYNISEEMNQKFSRIFDTLDVTLSGLLPSSQLTNLLTASELSLHIAEARQVLDPPGQGGAILKCEFIEWARQKQIFLDAKNGILVEDCQISSDTQAPFILYHYDGQGKPKPTLTRAILEAIDIDKASAQPDDMGLGTVLRTKWKNTLITVHQL